jgi:hypothetical protein
LCFAFLALRKASTVIASKAQQPFFEAIQASRKLRHFHLLLAMTAQALNDVRRQKCKNAQWIPSCAGMAGHSRRDERPFANNGLDGFSVFMA